MATAKKSPLFSIALCSLTLFVAASSAAMSLGRHRGAALIGRPLDISVQAVLDAQEDPAALCLEADVFYADNKLDKSRVRVTAEKTSPTGREALIHIRSSVLIDEPVVTFYLRLGCQQKTERRYVVLADLVSEVAALPVMPQTAGSVTAPPPAAQGANARELVQTPAFAPSGSARRPRQRAAAASAQAAPGTTPPPSAVPEARQPAQATKRKELPGKRGTAVEKGNARLKLEPLDLTIERDPQLRSSAELLSAPASSPQERSAAAALWRALTAQPQDILRDAEKLQALENDMRNLQAQARKDQLAIQTLDAQLTQARSERYANVLVYALGALLLLAIAALAYLLRRGAWPQRSGAGDLPWWRKNQPLEEGWAGSALEAGVSSSGDATGEKRKKTKSSDDSGLDLDLNLGVSDSDFRNVKSARKRGVNSIPPLSRRDRSDFVLSMTNPERAAKAEELFDVQQQADFFVSLGQHEQAIEVLRSHIEDSHEQTSALVYLDLFNLYHQLKRQDDYEALREDFHQRFNAKIPAYAFYTDASPGLEAYQGALTRIEALWPSAKVLDVIEESMFRQPDNQAEAFDLEAYRELLLLYAVAREIIRPEPTSQAGRLKFDVPSMSHGEDKTVKFLATSIQPLSASVVDARHQEDRLHGEALLPPASPRLSLDLDLSQFGDENEKPSSSTESDFNFFAQFAADVPVDPPASTQKPPAPRSGPAATDNLIEFDSFEAPPDDEANEAGRPRLRTPPKA